MSRRFYSSPSTLLMDIRGLYSKVSERVAEALLAINEPLTSPTRCHSFIDLKELNYRNTFYSITTTIQLYVSVNIQVLAVGLREYRRMSCKEKPMFLEKTTLSPTQPSSGLPSLGSSVQSDVVDRTCHMLDIEVFTLLDCRGDIGKRESCRIA
ncbi:hypothetical protein J6590_057170 [Homalodisca vitripennis]|nr:hypothetical protein J6590_057170 [Homalodisca vitripennis]